MTRRILVGSMMVMTFVILDVVCAAAQGDAPRTAWGDPDLQGVWDYRTITPLQRPTNLADKEFLTEEEAATRNESAVERERRLATRAARRVEVDPSGNVDRGVDGAPGSYNAFWFDRGTSVIATKRTSLIIDPPNGRIPALTSEAEKQRMATAATRGDIPNHSRTPGGWGEALAPDGLQARCLTGFNAGPPMTPGSYNNNMQLFQTPDTVVILNEMVHEARIVPLDGRPHVDLRQYLGDSRARWDGDTLVVTTTNFLRETSFLDGGSTADLQLTERFTRMSPDILQYQVTVDDPTTFTRPWTYEVPMQVNAESLYEYACHEGNYGMYNILAGAAMRDIKADKASR